MARRAVKKVNPRDATASVVAEACENRHDKAMKAIRRLSARVKKLEQEKKA